MSKFFLRLKVLPAIIFYGLLPRSIFNLPYKGAVIFVMLFSTMLIAYLLFRFKIVSKKVDNNLIVLDSICVLIGVILSCIFSYDIYVSLLFCVTAIPLFIHNHKVLIKTE